MNKEYFEKQIKGLIMIIRDNHSAMISRYYVEEKLNMILNGGINFHPIIKEKLEKL